MVTDVLEKATTDKEEEAAINKIAGEVQTDDEKMAKVNKNINEEQAKNKVKINYSEAIQDLKDGSYDKMMVGGKQSSAEKPCGADHPCPAEMAQEKPCGADHPCSAEKAQE